MKVLEPKVSKVVLDFGKTLKETQEVNVNLNANITYSKANEDNYLVTEILEMFLNNENKIFSIEVVCPVTFEENDEKDKNKRQEIIENDVFSSIYKKLKEVSDYLLSNATVALPRLPDSFYQN